MAKIFVCTSGVRDNIEVIQIGLVDDEIVDDSAFVVGKGRQRSLVVLQASDIADNKTFDERNAIFTADTRLDHVWNIEYRNMLPETEQRQNHNDIYIYIYIYYIFILYI